MNFTFEITDVRQAGACLALPHEWHPDHLISIGAPWEDPPKGIERFKGNLLRLKFNDVKTVRLEPMTQWFVGGRASPLTGGLIPPSEEHVKEIIDFGRALEDGHLLVHCHMGISRSTAAMLIVLAVHSDPTQADEIERLVHEARPIACPNDVMLEIADELLGWGGKLAAMGGWKERESVYGRVGLHW